jgi:pilus assembly protein CpaB
MKKVYLIASFVAVIAFIATFFFASQIQKNTRIKDVTTLPVVVAKQEIAENTVLTAEMFELKYYQDVSIVAGAAAKIEDVVGRLNRYPLALGEQVVSGNLITVGGENKNANLSYQLKPGEYAYTIDVDIVQGVGGFISQGDFVDILHTGSVGDTATNGQITTIGNIDNSGVVVTQILMKDIKVLRISDYAANVLAEKTEAEGGTKITSYSVVTLLLNEAQVIQLTQMSSVGRIRLALKPLTTGQDAPLAQVQEETTTAAS